MKAISVLGSTGSIGTQTLEIAEAFPERFQVVALTAHRNLDLLLEQIVRHQPALVALADPADLPALRARLEGLEPARRPARPPELVGGTEGLCAAAAWAGAELVVAGIVGCAGLLPTLAAIEAGKDIALANKETLIAAGPVVLPALRASGARLLPADSEHSAIFQCLQGLPWPDQARLSTGQAPPGLRRILLTASGGAFRDWDPADLTKVTVADATSHPNWVMGRKITVDSATLMNKGLEVIEAHYLFGLDYDAIDIVIHPQSIIHSMVELADTSVLAQLGWPDMKLPILCCLSWPERLATPRSSPPRQPHLPRTGGRPLSLHGAGLCGGSGGGHHARRVERRQRAGGGPVPGGADPLPGHPRPDRSRVRAPRGGSARPALPG